MPSQKLWVLYLLRDGMTPLSGAAIEFARSTGAGHQVVDLSQEPVNYEALLELIFDAERVICL